MPFISKHGLLLLILLVKLLKFENTAWFLILFSMIFICCAEIYSYKFFIVQKLIRAKSILDPRAL